MVSGDGPKLARWVSYLPGVTCVHTGEAPSPEKPVSLRSVVAFSRSPRLLLRSGEFTEPTDACHRMRPAKVGLRSRSPAHAGGAMKENVSMNASPGARYAGEPE
jgi:hypothetical protein